MVQKINIICLAAHTMFFIATIPLECKLFSRAGTPSLGIVQLTRLGTFY